MISWVMFCSPSVIPGNRRYPAVITALFLMTSGSDILVRRLVPASRCPQPVIPLRLRIGLVDAGGGLTRAAGGDNLRDDDRLQALLGKVFAACCPHGVEDPELERVREALHLHEVHNVLEVGK